MASNCSNPESLTTRAGKTFFLGNLNDLPQTPETVMQTFLCAIAIALFSTAPLRAAEAPAEPQASVEALIAALTNNKFAAFRDQGGGNFAKALNKDIFKAVRAKIGSRLKAGYAMAYLTDLDRQGNKITLWELTFKDEGDDALATLSMKKGKVAGFSIELAGNPVRFSTHASKDAP
jgi:hypothetical protein